MIEIGVDYYPEHWDNTLWDEDIALMKKTGVKVVRIAEFAWSRLEPREGSFEFKWLDKIIDKLSAAGLKIILGTPTNCPPLWMYRNYEETLFVERTGMRTETGIRGHRCLTSKVFRKFVRCIIEQMLVRYGQRSEVIAWQIDNELEANHCNCDQCTASFQKFLKEKYNSIDVLNKLYGNDVWSGDFSDFLEIKTALGSNYKYDWLNPSFMLDYQRFASQSTADFICFQRDIIREHIPPHVIITTNACFSAHTPDYYKIFDCLDIAAYDNYPTLYKLDDPVNSAQSFTLDLIRGYKRSNFWILEQMSGAFGCWAPQSPSPRPGAIKGYALQAIAHGANLVMHFRWRTSVKGAEMFCHGLLDHHSVPGRRFKEFEELCEEINALEIPDDTEIQSRVAILYSYEQEHAFKIQQLPPGCTYRQQAELLHAAYTSYGINVDVIEQTAELSKYDIVVVPMHFVTDADTVSKLKEHVKAGGIAIVTNRSGVKDKYNACLMERLPGAFSELCGAVVDEYDAIGAKNVDIVSEKHKYIASCWCDILELKGAEPYAEYASEYYSGRVAAARNKFGEGTAYYLGMIGNDAFYRNLALKTLEEASIPHARELPRGVEIRTRQNADVKITFIFNNSFKDSSFDYVNTHFSLKPFECKVIKEKR